MAACQLALAGLLLVHAVLGEPAYTYDRRCGFPLSARGHAPDISHRWLEPRQRDDLLLDTKQLWLTLFDPWVSPALLLEFFCLQRRRGHEHAIAEYAASCIHRGQIPLRAQIRLLENLFDVDVDVQYAVWQSTLYAVVHQWKLPGGYAMGIALRVATNVGSYERSHRERARDAFQFLVSVGAQFSNGLETLPHNLDVSSRRRRLITDNALEDDEDVTQAVFRLIDGTLPATDAFIARIALEYEVQCDDDVEVLTALVEHGLDINEVERGTGETCFTRAVYERRLRRALTMVMIGADFEEDDVGLWGTLDGTEIDDDGVDLLTTMVRFAIEPTKAFVDFFEAFSAPVTDDLLVLAGDHQMLLRCPGEWAHNVLVHMVTGSYCDGIDDVLPFIEPSQSVFDGVGETILRDFRLCRVDALDELSKISQMATPEALVVALEQTSDSGRTILHSSCMTLDIFKWVQERASMLWVKTALKTKVDGQSCLDLWLHEASLDQAIPLIHAYGQAVGAHENLQDASLYDVVAMACSEETLVTISGDRASLFALYSSATGPDHQSLHELLTSPRERTPSLLSNMDPYVIHRCLHVLLMEIAVGIVMSDEQSGKLFDALCAVEGGLLLHAQWPSDGWTPLHRAVAHPELHYLVPSIIHMAASSQYLLPALHVRDNNQGTFLDVAVKRLVTRSKLDLDDQPFKRLLCNISDALARTGVSSVLQQPSIDTIHHIGCGDVSPSPIVDVHDRPRSGNQSEVSDNRIGQVKRNRPPDDTCPWLRNVRPRL
ncbi:hypothetical protein PBRA_005073 [Plasmodiophora brassicae]|uniref:Uncharacterized protein n=1 Tax=Plasmodiophora brassicae TaxID=37360 RepID=A0A0G4IMS1_PLABS|nr:hypothetical protein PBRA_005073 [Plasmodiophora brassicae]